MEKQFQEVFPDLRSDGVMAELLDTVEVSRVSINKKKDLLRIYVGSHQWIHKKYIYQLERQIEEFAEAHRDDMDGEKPKTLNFGAVGFRKSTKSKLPKAPTKLAEITQLLRSKGMDDCVKTPAPSVDKDALREYPTQDIVAVGASIEEDAPIRFVFFCVAFYVKVFGLKNSFRGCR